MIEGIVSGVIIASIMMLINAAVRRAGVKTRADSMANDIKELKEGNIAILKVLKPMIVAIKGDQHNGDLIEAEKTLDEYLIKK